MRSRKSSLAFPRRRTSWKFRAGAVLLLTAWGSTVYAETDQRILVIKKVEEYPSHQVLQDLAIAVHPFASDAICNTVFSYKDIVSHQVLPVLVVIDNRSKHAIRLEGKDIYLTLSNADRNTVAPLELREVLGRLQKKKSGFAIPLPIPKSAIPKLDSKLDEVRARAFELKLIPPGQRDYGFVYYALPEKQILRELAHAYFPELTDVETRQNLMYFEIGLGPAMKEFQSELSAPEKKTKPDALTALRPPTDRLAFGLAVGSSGGHQAATVRDPAPPQQAPPPAAAAEPKPIVVPKKAEIVISLMSFVTTRTAAPGDKFYGQVAIPVVVDDRIVIPVNSYIVGVVRYVKRAGRIKGKAELALDFSSVIMPTGETRNLEARVRAADGYKSEDVRTSEGTIKTDSQKGKDAADITRSGAIGAGLGSVIVGGISNDGGGSAAGVAGGAAVGVLMTVLQRGADVELQKGTQLTLVLDKDIQLIKP